MSSSREKQEFEGKEAVLGSSETSVDKPPEGIDNFNSGENGDPAAQYQAAQERASTRKFNPCLCCSSCGWTLRHACVFVAIYYCAVSITYFAEIAIAAGFNPQGEYTCRLGSQNSLANPRSESMCQWDHKWNATVCTKFEECLAIYQRVFWFKAAAALLYLGAGVLLVVVVTTLRISILVFPHVGIVIVARILQLTSVYLEYRLFETKKKLYPNANVTRNGLDWGITNMVIAVFTTLLEVYFSMAAMALHFQIKAGEYIPNPHPQQAQRMYIIPVNNQPGQEGLPSNQQIIVYTTVPPTNS